MSEPKYCKDRYNEPKDCKDLYNMVSRQSFLLGRITGMVHLLKEAATGGELEEDLSLLHALIHKEIKAIYYKDCVNEDGHKRDSL